jgi:hypothetical protein
MNLYSIAIAVSSLCYPAGNRWASADKDKCQETVIACVLKNSKELDTAEFKERAVLNCYLKWRAAK